MDQQIDRTLAACMDWRIAVMRAQTSGGVGFSLQIGTRIAVGGSLRWTVHVRAAGKGRQRPNNACPAPHRQLKQW